ncbi:hypothetical protein IJT10_01425 [bacterium]|nr:hypothetical protein [bacterium]
MKLLKFIDYNSEIKVNAKETVDGSDTVVGELTVTNINFQPQTYLIKYTKGSGSQEFTEYGNGFTYDKENQKLVGFIDLHYDSSSSTRKVVKSITIDDYVYSGYIVFDSNNLTKSVSFSNFAKTGSSGSETNYSHQVRVRVKDLSYNPWRFSLSYTEGSSSTLKTISLGSYKDGILTFSRIATNASYITLKKVEVGYYVYDTSKRINLDNESHLEILSLMNDFIRNKDTVYTYNIRLKVPQGSYVKVVYHRNEMPDSLISRVIKSAKSYDRSKSEELSTTIESTKNRLYISKIEVNNHYATQGSESIEYEDGCKPGFTLTESEPDLYEDYYYFYNYMKYNSIIFSQVVSGVNSKPNSSILYYKTINDSKIYTLTGTYSSSAKQLNFCVYESDDIKVTRIVIDGKVYDKEINLNYFKPTNTIKFANMTTTNLVIKYVPSSANCIAVCYKLYNSKTGKYSSLVKKTAGTYSSANQTYTFPFTPKLLNGKDYDTVVVTSIALDNYVSTAERKINIGKTYNAVYQNLKAQDTTYSVNIDNGINAFNSGHPECTMDYTIDGKKYTSKGQIKGVRNSVNTFYNIVHFETVKTKAKLVKIDKICVGNLQYRYTFSMRYGQNKSSSNNEGINTRTLSRSDYDEKKGYFVDNNKFKKRNVSYKVTITNVASSVSSGTLKYKICEDNYKKEYSVKGKPVNGKINLVISSSSDFIAVTKITAGSKYCGDGIGDCFRFCPEMCRTNYSISYVSQMGKRGSTETKKTCSVCGGNGKCKKCKGSSKVDCSAAKMPGASKCFYCNDTHKTKCPDCDYGECMRCSWYGDHKGKEYVLKGVN